MNAKLLTILTLISGALAMDGADRAAAAPTREEALNLPPALANLLEQVEAATVPTESVPQQSMTHLAGIDADDSFPIEAVDDESDDGFNSLSGYGGISHVADFDAGAQLNVGIGGVNTIGAHVKHRHFVSDNGTTGTIAAPRGAGRWNWVRPVGPDMPSQSDPDNQPATAQDSSPITEEHLTDNSWAHDFAWSGSGPAGGGYPTWWDGRGATPARSGWNWHGISNNPVWRSLGNTEVHPNEDGKYEVVDDNDGAYWYARPEELEYFGTQPDYTPAWTGTAPGSQYNVPGLGVFTMGGGSSDLAQPPRAPAREPKPIPAEAVNQEATYICPITQELMQDPVKALDGKHYERAAIEEWFRRCAGRGVYTSPMTNERLASGTVTADLDMKQLIEDYKLRSPSNGDGAGEQFRSLSMVAPALSPKEKAVALWLRTASRGSHPSW